MYTILKVDKYGFDINEAQWKEESLKEFKENNEIININIKNVFFIYSPHLN